MQHKVIVTHINPDLDAIMSVWLLLRMDKEEYEGAEIVFLPAGETYKGEIVDSSSDVVHVDTGLGKFDHHQEGAYGTCASRLVYQDLLSRNKVSRNDRALLAMIDFANEIDTFVDCYYEESSKERFSFSLSEVIPAMHRLQKYDNEAVLLMVLVYLDAVYQRLRDQEEAKEAIASGKKFESMWGKSIAIVTSADDANKTAQKMGYNLVIVRDPKKMRTAIKTSPKTSYSLEPLYAKITLIDDPKRWYYHNSGHMLINGTSKKEAEPTSLTLTQIVELVTSVRP